MSSNNTDTKQQRWAQFRFGVVGILLSSPPAKGQLQPQLQALAQREWVHPITGQLTNMGLSTIERWYYQAKKNSDPVGALRPKRRKDAGKQRVLSSKHAQMLRDQYSGHKSWSYQLHFDNLLAQLKARSDLEDEPSYSTVRRCSASHMNNYASLSCLTGNKY